MTRVCRPTYTKLIPHGPATVTIVYVFVFLKRTGVVGKGQPPGRQTEPNKASVRSPALAALVCSNTVYDVPHDDHDPIHVFHISLLSNLILLIFERPQPPVPSTMRESNFAFPAQNRACVCISSQLYDRRGTYILPHRSESIAGRRYHAQRSTPTRRYPCSTPSPTLSISLQHLPASARL